MKIRELKSNYRPIILGDLGRTPQDLPKLTDEQLLKMQAPSTQWAMTHDVSEPYVIKDNWEGQTDATKIRPELYDKYGDYIGPQKKHDGEARKYFSFYKHDLTTLIDDRNKNGQFDDSTSNLRKKLAINVFNYTNKKIELSDPALTANDPKVEWRKLSWFGALIHWFKGGEIRRD